MAIQHNPVDSFSKKLNFWEEFPSYKIHPIFGDFCSANKKNNSLAASSLLMWGLALCYDRKSIYYNQPEPDKWSVVSEDLFGDEFFMQNLVTDPDKQEVIKILVGGSLRQLITSFEESIDTPLGMSLRRLERKLIERTDFITATSYTLDSYGVTDAGKKYIIKGTADQLDKMFTNTEKINSLIQAAMNELRSSETSGTTKGGQKESLSDGDDGF